MSAIPPPLVEPPADPTAERMKARGKAVLVVVLVFFAFMALLSTVVFGISNFVSGQPGIGVAWMIWGSAWTIAWSGAAYLIGRKR
jgi:hypothetical protein